jgi:hypothetical protein
MAATKKRPMGLAKKRLPDGLPAVGLLKLKSSHPPLSHAGSNALWEVLDTKLIHIRLIGTADPLVRGRPPGRPVFSQNSRCLANPTVIAFC